MDRTGRGGRGWVDRGGRGGRIEVRVRAARAGAVLVDLMDRVDLTDQSDARGRRVDQTMVAHAVDRACRRNRRMAKGRMIEDRRGAMDAAPRAGRRLQMGIDRRRADRGAMDLARDQRDRGIVVRAARADPVGLRGWVDREWVRDRVGLRGWVDRAGGIGRPRAFLGRRTSAARIGRRRRR